MNFSITNRSKALFTLASLGSSLFANLYFSQNTKSTLDELPPDPAIIRLASIPRVNILPFEKGGIPGSVIYRGADKEQFHKLVKERSPDAEKALCAIELLVRNGRSADTLSIRDKARTFFSEGHKSRSSFYPEDFSYIAKLARGLSYEPFEVCQRCFREDVRNTSFVVNRNNLSPLTADEFRNTRCIINIWRKDPLYSPLIKKLKKDGTLHIKGDSTRAIVEERSITAVADLFHRVGITLTDSGIISYKRAMNLGHDSELGPATVSSLVDEWRSLSALKRSLWIPYYARKPNIDITEVVIHDTESDSISATMNGLCGRCLAYHGVVGREDAHGDCEFRLFVNPKKWQVNHARGNNFGTIGFAFVGGHPYAPASSAQVEKMIEVLRLFKKQFPNLKYICGHKEVWLGGKLCGKPDPENVSLDYIAQKTGLIHVSPTVQVAFQEDMHIKELQ